MDRRRFITGIAGASTVGLAGCQGFRSTSTATPEPVEGPPRLHVDGRWLTDPDGNRVVLRGVNVVDPWWGVDFEDVRGKDYWRTLELAADADRGWHARVIRLPIQPRSVRRVGLETLLADYVDRAVDLARDLGVYIVLDYHTVERYDTDEVDDRVRAFWRAVAPRYADQPHVLYELFNEPTQPHGQGADSWQRWRETAQPWVDLVREEAPETPLLVGSPRWSSMTKYAAEHPFEGDDLVYTAHIFPSWEPESWEPNFGVPALDVPVFVTEWGYINAQGEDVKPHMRGRTSEWARSFREWLDSHTNVSWTAWNFSSIWKPNMFDAEWNLLGGDDYMGAFTKRWLRERRNDHQPGGSGGEATSREPGEPPGAPTGLRVTDRSPTTFRVEWDPVTDPDGDQIMHYQVRVSESDVRIVEGAETAATVVGLSPGTEYDVTVVAVDARGERSEASEPVRAATVAASVEHTIPRTDSAPPVDGEVGDGWRGVESLSVERVLVDPGDGDVPDAEWRGLWDDDALYYLVEVTDPDDVVDSKDVWKDDSVEIHVDPDYSRGKAYDGKNDIQYIVPRGADEIHTGVNSITDTTGVEFAQAETDDGWRLELCIPWSLFDVDPAAGHKLATDVHVNDDDDGVERDAKVAWYTDVDESWKRPELFGPVELGE